MPGPKKDVFGVFRDPGSGEEVTVDRYTLASASGVEVQVISYGACVSGVLVPDKTGRKEHVTLGFDDMKGYTEYRYQGSSVGRRTNRIGKGKLVVEGRQYSLTINNNGNHLHGGTRGWDTYVWESHVDGDSVVFSRLSPDGEEGYPGAVLAQVRYSLDGEGGLRIDFEAATTKATPINMTNHCFFNLAGHDAGQKGILEHVVRANADRYTPVGPDLIPTGELTLVRGTAYDLRSPTTFGEALPKAPGGGFDHNFCLQFKHRGQLELAASFLHPPTGRGLEVYTTEPGIQIYTGNFLPKPGQENQMVGRGGTAYTYQGAFCCEPQNFPDAVNQPNFPNDIYYPGRPYKHSMVYKFFVQK